MFQLFLFFSLTKETGWVTTEIRCLANMIGNDYRFSVGAAHDLVTVYIMEWLVEGNEIVSVRIGDLVSLQLHIKAADPHAFPPKCLLSVLIQSFGIIGCNTSSHSNQRGRIQDHFLGQHVKPQEEFDY